LLAKQPDNNNANKSNINAPNHVLFIFSPFLLYWPAAVGVDCLVPIMRGRLHSAIKSFPYIYLEVAICNLKFANSRIYFAHKLCSTLLNVVKSRVSRYIGGAPGYTSTIERSDSHFEFSTLFPCLKAVFSFALCLSRTKKVWCWALLVPFASANYACPERSRKELNATRC